MNGSKKQILANVNIIKFCRYFPQTPLMSLTVTVSLLNAPAAGNISQMNAHGNIVDINTAVVCIVPLSQHCFIGYKTHSK